MAKGILIDLNPRIQKPNDDHGVMMGDEGQLKKEKNIDTQALTKSSNRMARRSVVDSDGAFKGSTPAARAQA